MTDTTRLSDERLGELQSANEATVFPDLTRRALIAEALLRGQERDKVGIVLEACANQCMRAWKALGYDDGAPDGKDIDEVIAELEARAERAEAQVTALREAGLAIVPHLRTLAGKQRVVVPGLAEFERLLAKETP